MAVCLSVFLPLGALLPVLPLYLRHELGASDVVVGVLIAGFGFVALVCRPLAGSLTDRVGRRRVAVAGTLLCALSGVLYFVPGLAGPTAARLVLGVGEALATSATMAWAIDLAPQGSRGRTISMFGLAIWVGLSIGPLVGVALNEVSYDAVWAFAALLPLVGTGIALALPGVEVVHEREQLSARRRIVPPGVVTPGIAGMLVSIGVGVLEAFVVLHVAERGLGNGDAGGLGGLVYATFAASAVVTRILGGGLVDRFGGAAVGAVSCVVEAGGLVLIATAHSSAAMFAGAALVGGSVALLFPALAVVAVNAAPPNARGAAAATFTAFFDFGFASGGVVGGAIAARGTYADAFLVGAGCALAATAIAVAVRRHPAPAAEAAALE